jgi:hypothetical protein
MLVSPMPVVGRAQCILSYGCGTLAVSVRLCLFHAKLDQGKGVRFTARRHGALRATAHKIQTRSRGTES